MQPECDTSIARATTFIWPHHTGISCHPKSPPATATHISFDLNPCFQPNTNDTVFPVRRLLSRTNPCVLQHVRNPNASVRLSCNFLYRLLQLQQQLQRRLSSDPSFVFANPNKSVPGGSYSSRWQPLYRSNRDSPPANARVLGVFCASHDASLSLVPEPNEGSPYRVPVSPRVASNPSKSLPRTLYCIKALSSCKPRLPGTTVRVFGFLMSILVISALALFPAPTSVALILYTPALPLTHQA